jgi:hypothetical protein
LNFVAVEIQNVYMFCIGCDRFSIIFSMNLRFIVINQINISDYFYCEIKGLIICILFHKDLKSLCGSARVHRRSFCWNFLFFLHSRNPIPRKVYFVGPGERVKPWLSQTLTRGTYPDSNSKPAVQNLSPLWTLLLKLIISNFGQSDQS